MQSHEIRKKYLDFFVKREHQLYPSSSLVPHNDPTVLLTTAGMQQFIAYFTGQERPPSPRAASVQKCFRTVDLEEVGDPTHLTFFEMLGNFSFGDYFKREAIDWAWEFLTGELGLPPERLWITIFEGNEDAPEDLEAKEHWMRCGVPEERIFGLPKSENWWGPPGDTGPCGPCSEVYYDYGEEFGRGDPAADPAGYRHRYGARTYHGRLAKRPLCVRNRSLRADLRADPPKQRRRFRLLQRDRPGAVHPRRSCSRYGLPHRRRRSAWQPAPRVCFTPHNTAGNVTGVLAARDEGRRSGTPCGGCGGP